MVKSGREFFGSLGRPYREKKIQSLESKLARKELSTEKDRELEGFLDKIDFGFLKGIFADIARRSGIDPETLNLINPERIVSKRSSSSFASHKLIGNIILLDRVNIEEVCKYKQIDATTGLLGTLIHEEVHATSRNECHFTMFGLVKSATMGYSGIRSGSNLKKEYTIFNEGVTEKLAREVLRQYIKQTGIVSNEAFEKYLSVEGILNSEYKVAVRFIDAFIKKVSDVASFDRDFVWNAIVRGAYEGGAFEDKEFQKLVAESFGEDFLNKLARASAQDLENWIQEWRVESK